MRKILCTVSRHVVAMILIVVAAGAQAQLPPPPISSAPVTNYEYDPNGNVTRLIRAPGTLNLITNFTYDSLGRRIATTDAKGGVTRFGYTGRDDLTQVTDPRNLVTQYSRNGLGDVTQQVSPDSGTDNNTYDVGGRLLTRTDSRGVLETYTYAPLNRLASVVYSKAGSTSRSFTYTYDETGTGFSYGIGRLTSTAFPEGSTQYAYSPQGRLVSAVQRVNAASGANSAQLTHTVGYTTEGSTQYAYSPQGRLVSAVQRVNAASGANSAQLTHTVGYTYDGGGHVTALTYPSGRVLEATYVGGQLKALALKANASATPVNLITQVQWQPFGPPNSWQWQLNSGTQPHERVYDLSGRMVRYPIGSAVRDVTYDAANRITAFTHYGATTGVPQASLNQAFGFDELSRLTTINTSTATWTIGYDANGNRTSVALSGNTRGYTTAADSNRLTNLSNPAVTFSYDAAGNILSGSAATGYTANYALENRLATLNVGKETTTYAYDAMGQRVRKSGNHASSTVIFVYDQQGHLLGEYDDKGAALREFVWLGDLPVAVFTPTRKGDPDVFYIHTDHLNTPRVVVDRNNKLRWRWIAEPFGTTAAERNPDKQGAFAFNLRFPGQYFDQESGLFYNMARYLDPSRGGYTQVDPIGMAGGINPYIYVNGNPLSFIDPMGLDWVYSQSSGQLTNTNSPGAVQGSGYAGHGAGVSNPAMQHVQSTGPLPQGMYTIQPQHYNVTGGGTKLPASMRLTPDSNNQMYGRGGFLIHGDNGRGNQSASEGCIILDKPVRDKIGRSGDNILRVVP